MNPTIWDYYVLDHPTPGQLTTLGQQGWELVSVTCIVSGFSRSERAFFKRPVRVTPSFLQPQGK